MNGLIIIGAGGHGKVVADIADQLGKWDDIAFLDDRYPESLIVGKWKVIGKISEMNRFREDYPEAIIAIGANALRLDMQKRMTKAGFQFPVLIHPDASVTKLASIGAGTVICAQAAVIIDSKLGSGGIVNTGASVGHDCVLGDCVHVAPGARLAGNVSVGECSWIGIGSVVKEGVSIGREVMVGAGTTVIRDVPDGVTVVGSPGRILNTPKRGDTLSEGERRFVGFLPPSDPRWTEALSKTPHDFFHLPGYVAACARHEGGEPLLFVLDLGKHGMIVPLVRRSLAEFGAEFSEFYDLSSPYGYPGPLYWGDDWKSLLSGMHDQFYAFLREEKVVSLFLRLNPFVGAPDTLLVPLGGVVTHGPTVYMDLCDQERSWSGINLTNRRTITRLLGLGYGVHIDHWDTMEPVIQAYYETMRRLDASSFYFFPYDFFQQLRETTSDHFHLATAYTPSGEIVGGSFFTEVGGLIHYFLMGAFESFKEVSPSKLVINALRLWGLEHGHHTINLGGGVGSRQDSLFTFKTQMSKSVTDFSTFRKVILPEVFQTLALSQGWENLNDEFFPVYRKPLTAPPETL